MRLYELFDVRLVGRLIKKYVVKYEGGEKESLSLRKYAKEKNFVDVGVYSYGSVFSKDFNVGGRAVTVGRYCSFASNVNYYGANHPYDRFSTSPYFYNKRFGYNVKDVDRYTLNIGNDVWIGANVIITCGCKEIGNGAVVAAGAVVTHDVPAYSIVAGVPAKVVRYRFDKETINLLEKSKWYEYEPKEIMSFYKYSEDPKQFAEKFYAKFN